MSYFLYDFKISTVISFALLTIIVGCDFKKRNINLGAAVSETGSPSNSQGSQSQNSKEIKNLDFLKTEFHFSEEKAQYYEEESKKHNGIERIEWDIKTANEYINSGNFEKGIAKLDESLRQLNENSGPQKLVLEEKIKALLAISCFRLAQKKSNNEDAYILPIKNPELFQDKSLLLKSKNLLNDLLELNPKSGDYKYLLNIVHMTLGSYPQDLPENYLLPETYFIGADFVEFQDVSQKLNVAVDGLAGGVCVDDFNNDGFLDIICSSSGIHDQIKYFKNIGNGSFADVTIEAQLTGISGGMNMLHADYNNDGFLDFIILRGAGLGAYGEMPNTLMKNNGDGTFEDVTEKAGIVNAYPTHGAVWADFDRDGWLDLFIGNEADAATNKYPDQLYINDKNGRFTNTINESGIKVSNIIKGISASDVNNDGLDDILIAVGNGKNKLFLNQLKDGKLTFLPHEELAGIIAPKYSFSSAILDIPNNGINDIFISAYTNNNLTACDLQFQGINIKRKHNLRPRFYINKGDITFNNKSQGYGFSDPLTILGLNFGDLNCDGYLDLFAGTGTPSLYSIVPNKVFLNQNGKKFIDVTTSGKFGHMAQGHAIAFGDLDNDGDEDIYTVLGGYFAGTAAKNKLYLNPIGNKNNWISIQLEGTKSNRYAVGARIMLVMQKDSKEWRTFHNVGLGSSFGSSSIRAELGLSNVSMIDRVEIFWPNKERTSSVFQNIAVNQHIKIVEGATTFEVLELQKIDL